MMSARMIIALGVCMSVSACGNGGTASQEERSQPAKVATSQSAIASDQVDIPMKELMGHVMQFSAENVWNRQGYASDAQGERSLFPSTDEEWEEAESAGLTLAELTNVLLLPGRKVDDPRWDKAVAHVRSVALRAAKASESKDPKALFDAGSELDEACESCHSTFAPWGDRSKAIPK